VLEYSHIPATQLLRRTILDPQNGKCLGYCRSSGLKNFLVDYLWASEDLHARAVGFPDERGWRTQKIYSSQMIRETPPLSSVISNFTM
jgi:hypothetical protein